VLSYDLPDARTVAVRTGEANDSRRNLFDMDALEKIVTPNLDDVAGRPKWTGQARRAIGRDANEPLFKRFGVVKEWRTKDTGGS
jgi:hypothetical protein